MKIGIANDHRAYDTKVKLKKLLKKLMFSKKILTSVLNFLLIKLSYDILILVWKYLRGSKN